MMTGRGAGQPDVVGGPARHVPVLVRRVVEFLDPRDGASAVVVDGTFGAGGYSRAILEAASCRVIAIDRDGCAIAFGAGLVEQARGRVGSGATGLLIDDRGLVIASAQDPSWLLRPHRSTMARKSLPNKRTRRGYAVKTPGSAMQNLGFFHAASAA